MTRDTHRAGEDIAAHLERPCDGCDDPHGCAYRLELAQRDARGEPLRLTLYRCRRGGKR